MTIEQIKQQLATIVALTGSWQTGEDPNYGKPVGGTPINPANPQGPNRWINTGLKGRICILPSNENKPLLDTERDQLFARA